MAIPLAKAKFERKLAGKQTDETQTEATRARSFAFLLVHLRTFVKPDMRQRFFELT